MIKNRIYKALMAALAFGALSIVLPDHAARETSTATTRATASAKTSATHTQKQTGAQEKKTTGTGAKRAAQTSTPTPSVTQSLSPSTSPNASAGGISAPKQTSTSTPSVTQSPSPSPSPTAGGISAPPSTPTYTYYLYSEDMGQSMTIAGSDSSNASWQNLEQFTSGQEITLRTYKIIFNITNGDPVTYTVTIKNTSTGKSATSPSYNAYKLPSGGTPSSFEYSTVPNIKHRLGLVKTSFPFILVWAVQEPTDATNTIKVTFTTFLGNAAENYPERGGGSNWQNIDITTNFDL